MWMADEDRCRFCLIQRRRQKPCRTIRRIERSTRVEDEAVAGGMSYLNAASANLLSTPS
jgi:hypothetical protein